MFAYSGKTALVTGASSGIGEAFVKELSSRGANLILVARSKEKLDALAEEARKQHGVSAQVIVSDLTIPDGVTNVVQSVAKAGLAVDILVNNAGFGTYGRFEEVDAKREHDELMLNVVALVDLTHAFIPAMLRAKEGAVINVASIAGHQPVPYMATYAATKAFVLSFSEALWYEYKDRGVSVLSLDPGNTATNFHEVASVPSFGGQETSEQVVKVGLKALAEGRSSVISGFTNWIASGFLPRILPRQVMIQAAGEIMKPR
jgi:short-subunit dehydrogenase